MSVHHFAELVGVAPSSVSDWESRGEAARLRPSTQRLLDATLAKTPREILDRFEAGLHRAAIHVPHQPLSGTSPSAGVPSRAPDPSSLTAGELDALRQRVERALNTSVSDAAVDDWEAITNAHAAATRHRSPQGLVNDLAGDTAELERLLCLPQGASSLRRLTRLTAQMAGLLSLTLLKVNDRAGSRRWARTARRAAVESGDSGVTSWVRAQEAHTYFYAGDLLAAVETAREARRITHDAPSVGAALAAALEARALALQGLRYEAEDAMAAAECSLDGLHPDQAVWSALGYNEAQLRFHQGNALTHLGLPDQAWQVQQRALELYPDGDYLDRALVLLDRAACLVFQGEVEAGMEVALASVTALRLDQRRGIVETRAAEVLGMLPPARLQLPAAGRNLYELLRDDTERTRSA